MARKQQKNSPAELKGWTEISEFLSIPVSTAHRWARDGMPVRREGRFTVAYPEELRVWLGRESHMPGPVQILTDKSDLADALKSAIAATRKRRA
jgi:hypothetical protein